MSDERRMTTDRFYGGVSNRLENLQSMLKYIQDQHPDRGRLTRWVVSNTRANSEDAVNHHLSFLSSIGLVRLSDSGCELGGYGQRWISDQNPETLYDALSNGVKGFDTVLEALCDGEMTDEDIMYLLTNEFEEAEMSKPGPATRHREWLQVLGFVNRSGDVNRITPEGRQVLESKSTSNQDLSWIEAVRLQLTQYVQQEGETTVTLDEFYDFSENQLATQFPDNDHVRAKIRQQLQRLRDEGEIEFLDEQGTYRIKMGNEVEQQKTELEEALNSEPTLTNDIEEFTELQRRARDRAFAELVKEAYGNTCAICGSNRETPSGQPEVEAAHIYPRRKSGADDVRNGLALCKLHHWAFDTGWLAVGDTHEILVKDAPAREGFHEFKQLEGDQLFLPDNQEAHPDPLFLEQHRELHSFE